MVSQNFDRQNETTILALEIHVMLSLHVHEKVLVAQFGVLVLIWACLDTTLPIDEDAYLHLRGPLRVVDQQSLQLPLYLLCSDLRQVDRVVDRVSMLKQAFISVGHNTITEGARQDFLAWCRLTAALHDSVLGLWWWLAA